MKGEVIDRAFRIIQMFQAGPVTARMIQDRFDISRNAAVRWITQASIYLPIIESGKAESSGGRQSVQYELMNKTKIEFFDAEV